MKEERLEENGQRKSIKDRHKKQTTVLAVAGEKAGSTDYEECLSSKTDRQGERKAREREGEREIQREPLNRERQDFQE